MIEYTFVWPHGGKNIVVTGSFDNWTQSVTLEPSAKGHSKTVTIPVEKTLFKYVVDGEWRVDESDVTETDDHGNINNVLTIEALEELEGDIQELTQEIPGAFPGHNGHNSHNGSDRHGSAPEFVSKSVTVDTTASEEHDLQPSHVPVEAATLLENTLETKQEAVSGGAFIPAVAANAIPADSTTSQKEAVTHDLQPSSLDPGAVSKLEHAIQDKHDAVESGALEPIAVAEHAANEEANVTHPAAVPVGSFGMESSSHDLQPSALDPSAEAKLDNTISAKYSAVESGAISPVDPSGQSRAVPSTPPHEGGSRFHENETAPASPMSPHLAALAQRGDLPIDTSAVTPSSTAVNLDVPVGASSAGSAGSAIPDVPAESSTTSSSTTSQPQSAADVTITAGAVKKDKRRGLFRKIKDKMF